MPISWALLIDESLFRRPSFSLGVVFFWLASAGIVLSVIYARSGAMVPGSLAIVFTVGFFANNMTEVGFADGFEVTRVGAFVALLGGALMLNRRQLRWGRGRGLEVLSARSSQVVTVLLLIPVLALVLLSIHEVFSTQDGFSLFG